MRYPNRSKALIECTEQNILDGLPSCRDCTPEAEALEFGVDGRHYCDGKECFNLEKRTDYEIRLLHVGGLRFPEITNRAAIPVLEPMIVSHDFDTKLAISTAIYGSAIAVPYWRVAGLLSQKPALSGGFRAHHGLSTNQLLILHGEGRDKDLDRLFKKSSSPRFFEACAALSPVVLIAPGYSIYSDGSQCRRWQPYNLKLSAKFFSDASNFGLPCIPSIASNHDRDTARIIEWINSSRYSVTHLAVNFQTKGREVLKENIRFAKAIEAGSREQIHWIVFGVACETSINQLAQSLKGGLTFVTGRPLQRGRAGRSLVDARVVIHGDCQSLIDSNIIEQRLMTEAVLNSRHSRNSITYVPEYDKA